jgi:hypothetical protein
VCLLCPTRGGAVGSSVFLICQHITPDVNNDGKLHFSLGSLALGYVGWTKEGASHNCSAGDTESTSFVLRRLRELERKHQSCAQCQGGALMLDIGAGIGEFTLLTTHHTSLRVHVFEPGPLVASELKRNIQRNGMSDRVTTDERALANWSGTATLHGDRVSYRHGSVDPSSVTGSSKALLSLY